MISAIHWATSGINPSGTRYSNAVGSGFINILSLSPTGILDFNSVNNTTSGAISNTQVLFYRLMALNDATEKISNMRFWLPDSSTFNAGTYSFHRNFTTTWTQGDVINDTYPTVPTTLPTSQNIFRSDSGVALSGINENSGVTQLIYLAIKVGSDVPAKVYQGSLKYRLSYDYN